MYCLSLGPLIDESMALVTESHDTRACISRIALTRDRCVSLCERIEEMQVRLALYQAEVEQCRSEAQYYVARLQTMRKNQHDSDLKGGPSTSNFKTAAHLFSPPSNEAPYNPSVYR